MKSLHRPDLFCWSTFDRQRNIDFNAVLWVRPEGNILIDPLPLAEHHRSHLEELGGAKWIIVTNSDHARDTERLRKELGAKVIGPSGERESFPFACDRWASHQEEIVPGLLALELEGSKTPGELALLLDETTLITGDLIRAHRAGSLMLLPDPKLADKARAVASVRSLLEFTKIEAVLVGDGWSVFRDGHGRLQALV
jgi:hypothetical protein